jgi:hypothetical protein
MSNVFVHVRVKAQNVHRNLGLALFFSEDDVIVVVCEYGIKIRLNTVGTLVSLRK